MHNIKLLDCTLRDGSYIVDGDFGEASLKGIIKKLTEARVDIIECGWLKDSEYQNGSAYFHVPADAEYVMGKKHSDITYVGMIDYNRYDDSVLPVNDGKTLDAVRVVFPHGHHKEGIDIAQRIKAKGYKIYLQAANTLAYSEDDLRALAVAVNEISPEGLSVVDTFGAMMFEDLEKILMVLDANLDENIALGFHSHNNQQLSYALSIRFCEIVSKMNRSGIVDSSLCGMGRGAGNTTTELMAGYLNTNRNGNYDLNAVLDAIDMYMEYFKENYKWGYSTAYMLAGRYCCHVNNIAYLLENHRTSAKDIHNILSSMSDEDRLKYDYDLLEEKYIENQKHVIDDQDTIVALTEEFSDREVLLIAPGKSAIKERKKIAAYIKEKKAIVIGVNAILREYIGQYDYLFLVNRARYEYAKAAHENEFKSIKKIILSNIKTDAKDNESIITFEKVIERGYRHFDNAMITALRLMNLLGVTKVSIAGFDGFKTTYNESYGDEHLPTITPDCSWDELNDEIKSMYLDFRNKTENRVKITFVTDSIYNEEN